jgi:hypothetical protein
MDTDKKDTAPILPCSCNHEYQDAKYGKGRRVHTVHGTTKKGQPVAECTVCSTKKEAS